jgi:hypothetical protein
LAFGTTWPPKYVICSIVAGLQVTGRPAWSMHCGTAALF